MTVIPVVQCVTSPTKVNIRAGSTRRVLRDSCCPVKFPSYTNIERV